MSALASRKQLLLAESELNRAHLIHDLRVMVGDVRAITSRARNLSLIVSAVASLVAGLSFLRDKKSASAGEKPSKWQAILKLAGIAASLWSQVRAPDQAGKSK